MKMGKWSDGELRGIVREKSRKSVWPGRRVGFLPAETCFCETCGLNRIKVVKTTTHGKKLDLPYLMMQTLYHTRDSLTSA